MGKKKHDEDALEFDGETLRDSSLAVKSAVELRGRRPKRHETVAYVGRARVDKIEVKDVKDVATLHHVAKGTHAVIVEDALVEDVLNEDWERQTGQMRLLSLEGETRRAGRLAAEKRRELMAEAFLNDEGDESTWEPKDFAEVAIDALDNARSRFAEGSGTVPELMGDIEADLVRAAAVLLGGIEWCRRRLNEHLEAERKAAEADALEQARAAVDAAVVHSNEEQDKRERRSVESTAEVE